MKQGGAFLASKLSGGSGGLHRRQGAGVGQGCDAIFTDTDTASGQIVKQGGAALAKDLSGGLAGQGKRQLDKMGAGIGYVVEALPGGKDEGQTIIDQTGTIDGDGTEGSAQLGEAIGQAQLDLQNGITETAFGTTSGNGGPGTKQKQRRQLDKMGAGIGYVVEALPGGHDAGEEIINETGTVDGNGTEGSAMLGEAIGNAELGLGNAVTETAFGTTDGSGSTGGSGTGAKAPPPAPPAPMGKGH